MSYKSKDFILIFIKLNEIRSIDTWFNEFVRQTEIFTFSSTKFAVDAVQSIEWPKNILLKSKCQRWPLLVFFNILDLPTSPATKSANPNCLSWKFECFNVSAFCSESYWNINVECYHKRSLEKLLRKEVYFVLLLFSNENVKKYFAVNICCLVFLNCFKRMPSNIQRHHHFSPGQHRRVFWRP